MEHFWEAIVETFDPKLFEDVHRAEFLEKGWLQEANRPLEGAGYHAVRQHEKKTRICKQRANFWATEAKKRKKQILKKIFPLAAK